MLSHIASGHLDESVVSAVANVTEHNWLSSSAEEVTSSVLQQIKC